MLKKYFLFYIFSCSYISDFYFFSSFSSYLENINCFLSFGLFGLLFCSGLRVRKKVFYIFLLLFLTAGFATTLKVHCISEFVRYPITFIYIFTFFFMYEISRKINFKNLNLFIYTIFFFEFISILLLDINNIGFFGGNNSTLGNEYRGISVKTGFHMGGASLSALYIILFSNLFKYNTSKYVSFVFLILISYLSYLTGARATVLSILVLTFLHIFNNRYILNIVFFSLLLSPFLVIIFIQNIYSHYPFIETRFELWAIQTEQILQNLFNFSFGLKPEYWNFEVFVNSNSVMMGTHNFFFDVVVRFGFLFYILLSTILFFLFLNIKIRACKLAIVGLSIYMTFNTSFTHVFSLHSLLCILLFGCSHSYSNFKQKLCF
jgi:hypothetical protein